MYPMFDFGFKEIRFHNSWDHLEMKFKIEIWVQLFGGRRLYFDYTCPPELECKPVPHPKNYDEDPREDGEEHFGD